MDPILERGHHTKVATATPQAPEEVWVLTRTGREKLPISRDNICREQVVATEAVLAHEPAKAPTQRETRLGTRRAFGRIDSHALHPRQVNHETTIADGVAGDVMPTSTYGHQQRV